jgi:hypothetical protein
MAVVFVDNNMNDLLILNRQINHIYVKHTGQELSYIGEYNNLCWVD